ncbi:cytochrome c class I [Chitinophagaceae bacterium IBVUCB2]|nr:cytochrome c class I [Chitinophagaceae bacterium IBVUCB2]
MKKIIISFAVVTFLTSCGGGEDKKADSGSDKKETAVEDVSKNPVYQKGLELIAGSDCLTCHKVDEPLTGPSYRDVANKYAAAGDTIVAHLAGKIINGGKGVWGEVFMTPHASLSKEDAEAMVKYILLLKK